MNFFRLKRKWILALLSVVAIVLVACGDSATATPVPTVAPTDTPVPVPTAAAASTGSGELTAEEAEYIEQVRAGWNKFHSKAIEFRAAFAQTYSQKSILFQALLDVGAGTAFEAALTAVEQINPPERFKADQELMVQTLTEQVSHDHDVRSAAESYDLAGFTIANARLTELAILMAAQLPESVCRATEPQDLPFTLCSSNEQIPGGEYGVELNAALARFTAGFFGRLVVFGPHYEPADIIATEAALLPERIELVAGLLVDLEKMQPASGLADDHSKLAGYFEGLSEITKNRGAALDAQDIAAYQSVGAEGRALYCDAGADFSPDMTQIVGVYFANPVGGCGPAPTGG